MADLDIRARLALEPTPELYRRIRRLWIRHSIAEDRRDLEGLIATLAPDCVDEIPSSGQRWDGHDGARRFYPEFLSAMTDVHFDLTDLAIGPQGVIEVARMTGTNTGPWAGLAATSRRIELMVTIVFPWNAAAGRFAGERIYLDRGRGTSDADTG